jgi:hypothetical protein
MLSFLPGYAWFAIAGAIAATAPVIIHLLNRRRFRTVQWAAMDFLRQAVQRNRRILQIRDLVLLLLRTAALLLFGLALARPFFQRGESAFDPDSPLHVALVVDNSMSMGYQQMLGKRVLDEAQQRAEEVINALPERSLIAVIPLSGSEYGRTRDSYRNKTDAVEAVKRIDVVDRRGTVSQAIDLAQDAFAGAESDEAARRIVLVSDDQRANWPNGSIAERWKNYPEMLFVDVAPRKADNAWVDSVSITDGVADVSSPTTIVAVVRYQGAERRSDIAVNLTINGEVKDTKKIDLDPGQSLEVTFRYLFAPEERLAGMVNPVQAAVSLSPDQLPEDDTRYLIIPVVAELPVLFIDQYGAKGEDLRTSRLGETYSLRRLLAPKVSRTDESPQLIKVKHITLDELTQEQLREARLVVIAGVASPGDAVPLLREYVRQGGPLFIAAGGSFDPAQWQELAWKDGAGILPAPLSPILLGKLDNEISKLSDILTINPDTLAHSYFQFPEMSRADQARFFTEGSGGFKPAFFKLAEANTDTKLLNELQAAELKRISSEQAELLELDQKEKEFAAKEKKSPLTGDETSARDKLRKRRAQLEPNWLTWTTDLVRQRDPRIPPAKLAELGQPRVLASLSNGKPLFIERRIGEGTVTFFTSGLLPKWNFLADSSVFLVMDRVLRGQIEGTLPQRNLSQVEQFVLPVTDTLARYTLQRPSTTVAGEPREEPLAVEALGPDEFGVIVRNVTQRGIYRILVRRSNAENAEPIAVHPFAVNGPGQESELVSLNRAGFESLIAVDGKAADPNNAASKRFFWVDRGESVNMNGTTAWGQSLWWWLAALMLVALLAEMVICAWPAWRARRYAREAVATLKPSLASN